jgi:MoaA/NifB/PqqE/SkfB family radical SAM enzyme
MKYFLFSITNKCNKSCDYCIVKPWRNNPEYPDTITYEETCKYFSTRLGKGDVLEITGGEPTLVPWLETFMQFAGSLGAKVLLRTNGARMFQNKYDFLTVAFNPHGDNALRERVKPLLKKGDLIINPAITKEDKPMFNPCGLQEHKTHPFTETRFITADGKIRPMSCSDIKIGSIRDAGLNDSVSTNCPECPFLLGAWNMLNPTDKSGADGTELIGE